MQTVFKVDIPRDSEDSERPFIPRRVHKKSRGGCSACKKRRIKVRAILFCQRRIAYIESSQCDEGRPRCSKCVKTNTECVYTPSPQRSPKTLFVDERASVPLTSNMHTMCVDAAETELGDLLSLTSGLKISSVPSGSVRILQHFQNFTSLTLGGNACRTVFHGVVAKKAWDVSNPYLMHMVLAVSCAHLKRLYADPEQIKLYQQYSIAEAAHWQRGLQLYQKLLQSGASGVKEDAMSLSRECSPLASEVYSSSSEDGDDSRPDFDATLATTFLTIIFTFSLDDDIPADAYTDSDEDKFRHAINPLAATGGFRALRGVFGDFMHDSCWRPVLMGSDDSKGTFSNSEQPGIKGLPTAFVELCGLDHNSNAENNEYYHIVRLLAPLLHLDHDSSNFTKLIAFSGRTWPFFRPLVFRKDPRGLLLLAYWFALLRQLDQWWLTKRATTECAAIVNYLFQVDNPEITALLSFPASFGTSDLSYIWESDYSDSNSAVVFERYFDNTLSRKPRPLWNGSSISDI